MKKTIIILLLFSCACSFAQNKSKTYIDYNKNGRMDIYEDRTQGIRNRVEDLLSQMTMEEKQGQLLMDLGWQYYQRNGNVIELTPYAFATIKQKNLGSLWGFFRSDPWSGKTLDSGITPSLAAKGVNLLQKYMIDSTRLGIPMFIAEECMHGVMQVGSVVFPSGIAQAATWNEELIETMAEDIGTFSLKEGINICFGPMVDISRDARWSRVEETFGEDTYLSSAIGKSFVKGLVNSSIKDKKNVVQQKSVLPTLKHFAAYGISEGGHNGGSAHIGRRELKAEILPPFKACIDAGARLVMSSYNEIDGVPCTMNEYLLNDVLRKDWGFSGIVISDLHSIGGLRSHGVAKDLRQAAEKSINAGVDLDLSATDFYNNLDGVSEQRINEAVKRILYQKFACGLMDNPYVDTYSEKQVKEDFERSLNIAQMVASESIVLLKNDKLLPLTDKTIRYALIGPNSNNIYNQLGDYTGPNSDKTVTTIKQAFEQEKLNFLYAKGCDIRDTNRSGFNEAINIAKQSDVIVLCIGGSSSRYENVEYKQTGEAKINKDVIADITSGEGFDRSSLLLAGVQQELLKELRKLGKPIVVVLVNGRPLVLNEVKENCDALLECFYMGAKGGTAVIKTLIGENNPSGRLPISFPLSVGALPCYYNTKRAANRNDYLEGSSKALYPFGFGLSYTNFVYSDFDVKVHNNATDSVSVSLKCKVTNTGDYDGQEVVEVYIKKLYSTYATNEINLRAFGKKMINKDKSETFTINIDTDAFKEWNASADEQFISSGEYEVSVRKNADEVLFSTIIEIQSVK